MKNEVDDDGPEDSEYEPDDEEEAPKSRRGRNKVWVFVANFVNETEADDYLTAENTWSRTFTRMTEEGRKQFYRCNKVKRRGPQCSAALCLLFVKGCAGVIAYRTDAEHDHESIGNRGNYGISEQTKIEIDKLIELRLKPKDMLDALTKIEGIRAPTKCQLNNYLAEKKRLKFVNSAIYLIQLEKWISERTSVPEDENAAFVVCYRTDKDQSNFCFAVSTKRLLKHAYSIDELHVDTTYKLILQGNVLVLIVGTTDKNLKFHPLCLGVSNSERQEDFQMIFAGLKDNVAAVFNQTMQPKVLVCDAAQGIHNAFLKEFSMRSASSMEVLDVASRAFELNEKNQDKTRFMNYFKEEWLLKYSNKFSVAAPASSSTDNTAEELNSSVLDPAALQRRLPLPRFLAAANAMVLQWSQQSSPSFPEAPTLELQDWTEGCWWATTNFKINKLSSDLASSVYLIPSDETRGAGGGVAYDKFGEPTDEFWKVALSKSSWKNSTCSCPQFFQMSICKHVLGLAIRMNLVTPPPEAEMISLGEKRKRGRPPLKCKLQKFSDE